MNGWIEKREDRREHDRMDYLQKAFFTCPCVDYINDSQSTEDEGGRTLN